MVNWLRENRVAWPTTRRRGRACITCRRASTRLAVARYYAKRQAERTEANARRELQRIERDPLTPAEREARPICPWPDEASA